MSSRIRQLIDQLRTSFWFLPSLMLFAAAAFALFLLYVDQRVDPGIKASLPWAYSGGAEGARSLLSTIAGSMITAASVTFSLASVALSIASQQYGSRVLRNFMRDRITQVLLGTFVSTFIYSVLVVRSIRGSDYSGGFVPSIAVTGAIVLSLISLVLLIYFVHHVSTSIQASHIVSVISQDLASAIPELYPSQETTPSGEAYGSAQSLTALCTSISADQDGYVQSIDLDLLMKIATRTDAVLEVLVKPGDHFVAGGNVACFQGPSPGAEDKCSVVEAFSFGMDRTPLQDIRYQFQQLTDVVVRALSPGINDPFTAVNGIDALASGICQLARQPRPAESLQDEGGNLRLILARSRLEITLDDTVGHIAIYAAGDRFVMAALRRVLEVVEPHLQNAPEKQKLFQLRAEMERLVLAKEA